MQENSPRTATTQGAPSSSADGTEPTLVQENRILIGRERDEDLRPFVEETSDRPGAESSFWARVSENTSRPSCPVCRARLVYFRGRRVEAVSGRKYGSRSKLEGLPAVLLVPATCFSIPQNVAQRARRRKNLAGVFPTVVARRFFQLLGSRILSRAAAGFSSCPRRSRSATALAAETTTAALLEDESGSTRQTEMGTTAERTVQRLAGERAGPHQSAAGKSGSSSSSEEEDFEMLDSEYRRRLLQEPTSVLFRRPSAWTGADENVRLDQRMLQQSRCGVVAGGESGPILGEDEVAVPTATSLLRWLATAQNDPRNSRATEEHERGPARPSSVETGNAPPLDHVAPPPPPHTGADDELVALSTIGGLTEEEFKRLLVSVPAESAGEGSVVRIVWLRGKPFAMVIFDQDVSSKAIREQIRNFSDASSARTTLLKNLLVKIPVFLFPLPPASDYPDGETLRHLRNNHAARRALKKVGLHPGTGHGRDYIILTCSYQTSVSNELL